MHLARRSLLALAIALGSWAGAADVSASTAPAATTLATDPGGAFDRDATAEAMKAVDVTKCKRKKGPTGDGHVAVTFAATGAATDAVVDRPPYAGTKVGGCVAKAFKKAKIPAFKGDPVVVGKNFHID